MGNRIKLLITLFTILWSLNSSAQRMVRGKVTSATEGQPLTGAYIYAKGTHSGASTTSDGTFDIKVLSPSDTLQIKYLGYKTKNITVNDVDVYLPIFLEPNRNELNEVIVSTGYQEIPKERSTGSFVALDNVLLNRRVSANILERLEDITPGLIFNRSRSAIGTENSISIRGQSTLYGNTQPLIVVDNFPYDADISTINPNDVESITVLRDAAAASVWGARAGNGVIVITTKKGLKDQRNRITANANVTIGDVEDIFYDPLISTAEYIEIEKMLFAKDYYRAQEISPSRTALTPVVELLIAERDNLLPFTTVDAQIETLKQQDVRNDLRKYFYQRSINQQYSVNLQGGSKRQQYFSSIGYDKNKYSLVNNEFERITLNTNYSHVLIENKLELNTAFYFTKSTDRRNNPGIESLRMNANGLYPYARLADEGGNPLSIIKDYRAGFVQSMPENGLLDWGYRPLEELYLANNVDHNTQSRVNASLKYRISSMLDAEVLYQYSNSSLSYENLRSSRSYYTRDLINQYTQVDGNGSLSRPIPLGAIFDMNKGRQIGHNLRGQLNFKNEWNNDHNVSAMLGYEIKDVNTARNQYRYYGYDEENGTPSVVRYATNFNLYHNPQLVRQIPYVDGTTELSDRFLSYYGNAAYTYKRRYTISGSARIDRSNIFGVNINQKAVPLWSLGLSWNISDENFYKVEWLPYLKLRSTYGYNGNIYKDVSAYTTANYRPNDNNTNLPYAIVINPPNPDLRWEKVRIGNLGLDFSSKNQVVNGSVEFYSKKGIDLIGRSPFAPATGIITFTGNTASTSSYGLDINLEGRIIDKTFKWSSNVIWSFIRERVTDYNINIPNTNYLMYGDGGGIYPKKGKPLYALYSLAWAGLDPETGNPQGYLNNEVSVDYNKLLSSTNEADLIYNGPAQPTSFGAIRNTFTYKGISLSANISFRYGYYFRRPSVRYNNILTAKGGHSDYSKRWQQPGDEQWTNVPSLPENVNVNRDNFYALAELLVEKGDHIRLQDINVSYMFNKRSLPKLPFETIQLYLYANNLGVLWKAYDGPLDPDYSFSTPPPPRTYALGLRMSF